MAYNGGTTWLNSNPNLGIQVWYWDPVRSDNNLTQRISFCLLPIGGYDYWGFGASISWGYYHPITGRWIQGEDHQMVDTSISQWGEIWWEPAQISLDVGENSGSLHISANIYSSNTGQWGTAVDVYIPYESTSPTYIDPSRGDVSYYPSGITDPYDSAWFSTIHIDYSNFNGGSSGIAYYGVFKYEWGSPNIGTTSSYRSGIAQIWNYGSSGSFDWNGKPPYPMYYLKNKQTGKYLDVIDGLFQNDQRIRTYPFNGSQAQRWGFEPVSGTSDRYYLHPDCTYNAMIHTVNTGTASGTELCLWTYTGAPTTQWLVEPTGDPDGSVYIRLVANTKQVIDANVDTGGITIWEFYAQDNQKWILEDASDAWLGTWMSFDIQVIANDGNECEGYNQNRKVRMYTIPGTLASNQLSWSNQGTTWQGGPVTCRWSVVGSDNSLRVSDTYEISIERQYNDVWCEYNRGFSNTVNYTFTIDPAIVAYEYRYRIRAYNIFDAAGPWSEYSHSLNISGPSFIDNKTCTIYVVQDGKWVPTTIYLPISNMWKYTTVINPEGLNPGDSSGSGPIN